ncbi:hypothetical protein BGZ63DRAFT_381048 [Mariannaea sp. PMI_226]|nr:hypothetical protein BGZ63DRAFT_381048 [Mariannaea sp. PMI_226]
MTQPGLARSLVSHINTAICLLQITCFATSYANSRKRVFCLIECDIPTYVDTKSNRMDEMEQSIAIASISALRTCINHFNIPSHITPYRLVPDYSVCRLGP